MAGSYYFVMAAPAAQHKLLKSSLKIVNVWWEIDTGAVQALLIQLK